MSLCGLLICLLMVWAISTERVSQKLFLKSEVLKTIIHYDDINIKNVIKFPSQTIVFFRCHKSKIHLALPSHNGTVLEEEIIYRNFSPFVMRLKDGDEELCPVFLTVSSLPLRFHREDDQGPCIDIYCELKEMTENVPLGKDCFFVHKLTDANWDSGLYKGDGKTLLFYSHALIDRLTLEPPRTVWVGGADIPVTSISQNGRFQHITMGSQPPSNRSLLCI